MFEEPRWDSEPGDEQNPACGYCQNNLPGRGCKAFPDGIPEEILSRQDDHLEPLDGDNGIQFEPREGWELPKRLQR